MFAMVNVFKYRIWDSVLGIMNEIKQEIAGKRK